MISKVLKVDERQGLLFKPEESTPSGASPVQPHPHQATKVDAPLHIKKHKSKNSHPICTTCHHFLRVNGKPACTNIPIKPNKPGYKLLRSLEVCSLSDYWPIHEVEHIYGLGRRNNANTKNNRQSQASIPATRVSG